MTETRVINIRDLPLHQRTSEGFPKDHVYIGRAGKGFEGKWGNPYALINNNDPEERNNNLELYRSYLVKQLESDGIEEEDLLKLHGKTLVCFCKPKDCHGDILAKAVDYHHSLWSNEDETMEKV